MVQSRARLRFLETPGRSGRRGCVRAHGDGAHGSPARAPARPTAAGAHRAEFQGTDRDRSSRRRILGLAVIAAGLIVACSPSAPAENVPADERAQSGLAEVPLIIHSQNGDHRFTVEVAATFDEQERGLMFRRSLDPNGGMIFPYDPPQPVAFWMKNTLIPLDMVFIRADGHIARIAENKIPLSLESVSAGEPVAAVLELRGGRSAELRIRAGDRVDWHR